MTLIGLAGELVEDGGVDVADLGDAGVFGVGLERGEVRVGAAVEADDGEVDALVGAHDLGIGFGGGGDGECGGRGRCGGEELAARLHGFSLSGELWYRIRWTTG